MARQKHCSERKRLVLARRQNCTTYWAEFRLHASTCTFARTARIDATHVLMIIPTHTDMISAILRLRALVLPGGTIEYYLVYNYPAGTSMGALSDEEPDCFGYGQHRDEPFIIY